MAQSKILFISNPLKFQPLQRLLAEKGFKIVSAQSKAEAETALVSAKIDLIIADIFYKDMDVLSYLNELKQTPGCADQRVLVIGEEPLIELVVGASSKVTGYLSKPFEFETLQQLILKAAGNAKQKIVYIDAESESRSIMQIFFDIHNYEALCVDSTDKAWQIITEEHPSVIITNLISKDETTGFELIKKIQSNEETTGIPIIVLSYLKLNTFQKKGFLTGYPEIISAKLDENFLLNKIEQLASVHPVETSKKPKILLADDQELLIEAMTKVFEVSGFEVITASDGGQALDKIKTANPDIIILDYDMPVKTGFEVVKEIKKDPSFSSIPIIILTAMTDKQLKLEGLSLDINDYMLKPIDTDELIAKVKLILKKHKKTLDTNPLTHLPGNPSIQAEIEEKISGRRKFAVLYVDLDQFKAYNDSYGFNEGDRVIVKTANLLTALTRQSSDSSGFVGHIGGDDFIIVTTTENAQILAEKIIKDFAALAGSFYNSEDKIRQHIISEDRQGNIKKFPLMTISIGIVHNLYRPLTSIGQISQIGAELKSFAKTKEGNFIAIDKRKD